MFSQIRAVCVYSVLCGAILNSLPESGIKRITNMCSISVIILILLNTVSEVNLENYGVDVSMYREYYNEIESGAETAKIELNRFVIEEKSEAYIYREAEKLGLEIYDADVSAVWADEGLWVPHSMSAVIKGKLNCRLCEKVEAELGILRENQVWTEDA